MKAYIMKLIRKIKFFFYVRKERKAYKGEEYKFLENEDTFEEIKKYFLKEVR